MAGIAGRDACREWPQNPRRPSTDMPSVLVVDDEVSIQLLFGAVLVARGYQPVTVGRVSDALAVLNTRPIDAVILDIRMPGASGLSLLECIRVNSDWRHVPVLILTGSHLTHAEERLIAGLGAHVFFKPEHHDVLVGQLDHLVRRRIVA